MKKLDSQEQFQWDFSSVTRSAVELTGSRVPSSCREYTHLRDEAASNPKGAIRNDTKIGPALGVVVTTQYNRHGVEIEIDSMVNDGTSSQVVISKDLERCVTEPALEHTEPMRVEEHTKHRETRCMVAVIRLNHIFIQTLRSHSDEAENVGLQTTNQKS